MGQLVLLDPAKGWQEADGLVQRISGQGDLITPLVRDDLVGKDWPKFLHPFPLSEKYFLVAAWPNAKANWGIYLADVFDNLTLLRAVHNDISPQLNTLTQPQRAVSGGQFPSQFLVVLEHRPEDALLSLYSEKGVAVAAVGDARALLNRKGPSARGAVEAHGEVGHGITGSWQRNIRRRPPPVRSRRRG
jgi:hypothetical protein